MGPFEVLMSLGANVVAVDLDRPGIWKRLIERARNSSGSITFPMTKEQKDCANDDEMYASAGCNLFTETPLIRDWLVDLYPDKPFTVGSYAYLNGALHVQVSLAMDAICRDMWNLTQMRGFDITKHALACFGGEFYWKSMSLYQITAPWATVQKSLSGQQLVPMVVQAAVSFA